MRHRVYGKKFSRDKNERTSLFNNLVRALFTHGTIETSETKAKAVKGLIDKIITLAKTKDTQRLLQTYLTDKALQERLIKDILPKVSNRVSGYTSLMRLGKRSGDRASMVKMSIIGAEELKPLAKKEVKKEAVVTEKVAPVKEKVVKKATKGTKSK